MTLEDFNQQKAECAKILKLIAETEQQEQDIKGLFLKIYDLYLKKEQGWRHTDEFKEIIKQL
jgi:hypothetical protein